MQEPWWATATSQWTLPAASYARAVPVMVWETQGCPHNKQKTDQGLTKGGPLLPLPGHKGHGQLMADIHPRPIPKAEIPMPFRSISGCQTNSHSGWTASPGQVQPVLRLWAKPAPESQSQGTETKHPTKAKQTPQWTNQAWNEEQAISWKYQTQPLPYHQTETTKQCPKRPLPKRHLGKQHWEDHPGPGQAGTRDDLTCRGISWWQGGTDWKLPPPLFLWWGAWDVPGEGAAQN